MMHLETEFREDSLESSIDKKNFGSRGFIFQRMKIVRSLSNEDKNFQK